MNERMNEKSRDTQFQGFAKALVEEMCNQTQGGWIDFDIYDQEEIEKYSLVVARRAYDFAAHAISSFQSQIYQQPNSRQLKKYLSRFCEEVLWLDQIPDMRELPKRSQE